MQSQDNTAQCTAHLLPPLFFLSPLYSLNSPPSPHPPPRALPLAPLLTRVPSPQLDPQNESPESVSIMQDVSPNHLVCTALLSLRDVSLVGFYAVRCNYLFPPHRMNEQLFISLEKNVQEHRPSHKERATLWANMKMPFKSPCLFVFLQRAAIRVQTADVQRVISCCRGDGNVGGGNK